MTIRTILHYGLLVAGGIIAGLLFGEILLRIWTPSIIAQNRVRISDSIRHHRLRPSSVYLHEAPDFSVNVKTNALGMRDREYSAEELKKSPILFLGDSFTEGWGVESDSCFVKRLERRINIDQAESRRVAVLNFGTAGYSPILEYLLMRDVGMAYHPSLVVLCYDMSDVAEDSLYATRAEFDRAGVPLRVASEPEKGGEWNIIPPGSIKLMLEENSYLFSAVKKSLYILTHGNMAAGGTEIAHTFDDDSVRWKRNFDRSEGYVELVHNLCASHHIPFALAILPRGHQISSLEWTNGRNFWKLGDKVYTGRIFDHLEHFSQEHHVTYLDMTPSFRRRSKGDLCFRTDTHWTSAGHAVAADTLYQFLREHDLIRY